MRLRVRTMMAAIALIAVCFPVGYYVLELREQRRYYGLCVAMADSYERACLREANDPQLEPAERSYARREAAWHAARSLRFKRGVRQPWLTISEPEPLPPLIPRAMRTPAVARAASPPEPAPIEETGMEDVKPIVDLTPFKSKMSPEAYANIQRRIHELSRSSAATKRRAAERRSDRSQQRMDSLEPPPDFKPDAATLKSMGIGAP